jgi:hypothetical protein
MDVLARRLVGEHLADFDCSSCRSGFWSKLLTRTADALTLQDASQDEMCQEEIYDLCGMCQ